MSTHFASTHFNSTHFDSTHYQPEGGVQPQPGSKPYRPAPPPIPYSISAVAKPEQMVCRSWLNNPDATGESKAILEQLVARGELNATVQYAGATANVITLVADSALVAADAKGVKNLTDDELIALLTDI